MTSPTIQYRSLAPREQTVLISTAINSSNAFDPLASEHKRIFDKRHASQLSSHARWIDEEMIIALQRKGAGSTAGRG